MTDVKTITGHGTGAPNGHRSLRAVPSQRATALNLGPLQDLPGFWEGTGFSLTARPDFSGGNPDGLFLELNLLRETIEFTTIGSPVMNRGSVQGDIAMYGVTYLHRVTDATTGEALHIEPGLFLNVPATAEPRADASIARLATIPHGTSFCAVGFAQDVVFDKLPEIPPANTVPFPVGSQPPPPGTANPFPEYHLSAGSRFRTVPTPAGITQEVIDDPHVVLRRALRKRAAEGHVLTRVTWLITSTERAGGLGNIPFIVSNANPLSLESVFSVETVRSPAGTEYLQLGYSQTALLNFRGLSFPHVTVGTLIKAF
jgi:hypothetical protein